MNDETPRIFKIAMRSKFGPTYHLEYRMQPYDTWLEAVIAETALKRAYPHYEFMAYEVEQ